MDKEKILASLIAAVESSHFFSAFLPSVFTIRTFRDQPLTVDSIRKGEAYATTFALGLGVLLAYYVESPLPVLITAVMCVLMIWVYEKALVS